MELKAKTALVTGAANGIGRAIALELARAGSRLVVCDLDEDGLHRLRAEVEGRTECLLAERVDVADRDAMRAFAERVHAHVPAVDVLVNNAGVGIHGQFVDTSLDDWSWIVGVNLWGVIHGCHFFVAPMIARGAGHVVNISSVLGYMGAPETSAYAATKFGVFGLSESLRAELAPQGIGVSTICPGIIATGIIGRTRFRGATDGEALRDRVERFYRRRNYRPDKVGRAVVAAIRNGRTVVPVSPEAWGLYYLKRLVPDAVPRVARMLGRQASGG